MDKEKSSYQYGYNKGQSININIFFLAIIAALLMILLLFKPLKIKEQEFIDIPLLEMSKFIMYELNAKGLQTFMAGSKSLRYKDRYVVSEIDFTDNSKQFISNMKADSGIYKNDVMDLKGNIIYIREDGLEIKSKSLQYNTKSSVAKTDDTFVLYMKESSMNGSSIVYNSLNKTLESKNVTITYNLQERK